MRFALTVAAFLMLPGLAHAACQCACVNGQAKMLCEKETDFPIVCMRLCLNVPTYFNDGMGGGPPLHRAVSQGAPMAPMAPAAAPIQ